MFRQLSLSLSPSMKSLLPSSLTLTVLFALFSSISTYAVAADETVTGNLTVEGDADVEGAALSLGTRSDSSTTPGLTLLYADASAPSVYFIATRNNATWIWQADGGRKQMEIDGDNKLKIFDKAANPVVGILLDPSGVSNFTNSLHVSGLDNRLPLQTLVTDGSILTRGIGDSRYLKNSLTGGVASALSQASGEASVAVGSYNQALGYYSVAVGHDNTASGYGAVAIGADLESSGYFSSALGYDNVASGDSSFSVGHYNIASGWSAVVMGYGNTASGSSSMAVGAENQAIGQESVAMGSGSFAIGYASFAAGSAYAAGDRAVAMGDSTTAYGHGTIAMGINNVVRVPSDPASGGDDLFILGNAGLNDDYFTPRNAFVVHKNGNVRAAGSLELRGVIRTRPAGDLSMGAFTGGTNPAGEVVGLNIGLRYPGE